MKKIVYSIYGKNKLLSHTSIAIETHFSSWGKHNFRLFTFLYALLSANCSDFIPETFAINLGIWSFWWFRARRCHFSTIFNNLVIVFSQSSKWHFMYFYERFFDFRSHFETTTFSLLPKAKIHTTTEWSLNNHLYGCRTKINYFEKKINRFHYSLFWFSIE